MVQLAAEPVDAAIAALRASGQVKSVTQMGGAIHALLDEEGPGAAEMGPRLGALLEEEGFERVVAEVSQPNLEDVFVALILGESLAEGAEEAA